MNFQKQKAIYMQIADYVLDNIVAQKFKVGDRMQSVRELAATVQVNPNTIMRTFNYLQDKGVIFNKRGIGYFISEDAKEKAIDIKKDDFIKTYLPQFFKTMELLNLSFEDLQHIYQEQQVK